METAFDERVARYRELLCVVNGQPAPQHREEFAWVVAALRGGRAVNLTSSVGRPYDATAEAP